MKKLSLAFVILQFFVVSLHVGAADITQNSDELTQQDSDSAISACMMKNKTVPDVIQGNLKDTYCCLAADKRACLNKNVNFVKWVWDKSQNYLESVIANCPYPVNPVRLKPCDSQPTAEVLSCLLAQIETMNEKVQECPEGIIPAS